MQIIKYTGTIKVISGLHIGGGDDTMQIGGVNNSVIKNINTGHPYIPGSSIKGKMRSLLEWHYGLVGVSEGEPFSPRYLRDAIFDDEAKLHDAVNIMKLFGTNMTDEDQKVLDTKLLNDKKIDLGITRISIGDCQITSKCEKAFKNDQLALSESKYENVIDRKSGTAKHPRQTERIPADVEFDVDIRIKVLDKNEEDLLKSMVEKGIELISNDYLGGNGSRGYGRVAFDCSWSA
jgi:CRISPR-associated protein Csm3